jgi:lactoylglutathione lyase
MRFTHLRLLVKDYRSSFYFYTEVLGLKCMWGDLESGYADLKTGDTQIALYDRQAMADAVGTGDLPGDANIQDRCSMIFEVESVDKTADALEKKGIELITEPQDRPEWGIRTAHLRDPDGNLIELFENLPENQV